MNVSEASAVEEVVLVAGNSVGAVMVTEIVAVEEAIEGTDFALEELVETDAAVVRNPCSVVVWGTVADAVVAVVTVAWTAEIAVEAVIIVGPDVVVVVVETEKFVGKFVAVEIVIEAGVDAVSAALLVANFEAEGAVEVVFGLVKTGGTVAGNVLVVVVVVPGTVAVVVETVAEVATVAGIAMVVEAAWVAEALMAAEDAELSEAATVVEDAEVPEDAMAPEDAKVAEVAEVAAAAEEAEFAEAVTAAEDAQVAEVAMAAVDDEIAEAAKVVEVVNFVEDAWVVELAWETGTAGFASSVKVDLVQIEEFVTLNSVELAAGTLGVTQPGWDTVVGMLDAVLLEIDTVVEE